MSFFVLFFLNRCMKPNSEKAGDLFVTPMMLEQLRYSGLLEVCTIRKMGFPIRRVFDEFVQRYACISPSATNIDALLQDLVAKVRLDSAWHACFAFPAGAVPVWLLCPVLDS